MPSIYSPNSKSLELMATGENNDVWGVRANTNFSILDLAFGGRLNLNVAGNANVTLTAAQTQNMAVVLTGALTGNIQVIFPNKGGFYLVTNNTTGAFSVTLACVGGTVPQVIQQSETLSIFVNPDVPGVGRLATNRPLANTGVAAGTYNWANVTVGADGRITAATANVAPLPTAGGTITGNLTVNGTTTMVGQTTKTASDSFAYSVAGGGFAIIRYTVAGARAWWVGCDSSGLFNWFDVTGNASRMYLSGAGVLTVGSTVNAGSFNTGGNITGAQIQGSGNILGGAAVYVNYPTVSDFYLARGAPNRVLNFAANWSLTWNESPNDYFFSEGPTRSQSWWARSSDSSWIVQYGPCYATSFPILSDDRLKRDVTASAYGLAEVLKIEPIRFTRTGKAASLKQPELAGERPPGVASVPFHPEIGFSAQQLREVIPETVVKFEVDREDSHLAVEPMGIVAALVNAIKTIDVRLQTLEAR